MKASREKAPHPLAQESTVLTRKPAGEPVQTAELMTTAVIHKEKPTSIAPEARAVIKPTLPPKKLPNFGATNDSSRLFVAKEPRDTVPVVAKRSVVPEVSVLETLETFDTPAPFPEFTRAEPVIQSVEITDTTNERADFETESMDVFEQLIILGAAVHKEYTATEELDVAEVHEATAASKPPDRFETFIALSRPTLQEAPTIESIREMADEQPLEETFIQLAAFFAEKTEDLEISEEAAAIEQLVQEIGEELERLAVLAKTETSEKPLLTPEITQKLLQLLSALGYKHTQEALIQFVEKYDLEFLVQGIKYLYQLIHDENRQEFLSPKLSMLIATDTDSSVIHRLGKSIFNFVLLSFVPAIAD